MYILCIIFTAPDSSAIICPAKEKENLDRQTVNKLAKANSDFEKLLKDFSNKEIRKERYDKILDVEELVKSIKK